MLHQTLTEEEIDRIIDFVFIYLELCFTDEEYPGSKLSQQTKIGDILDTVVSCSGNSVRDIMESTAADQVVTLKLNTMPGTEEILEIAKQLVIKKSMTKIDISSVIQFFMPLTIKNILAYQSPAYNNPQW